MKIDPDDFRVDEGRKVDLKARPTRVKPYYRSKQDYHELLSAHQARLTSQQGLLYATDRYSLLLIFQAMDTAGKDGAIKHVMSGVNPQGCQVHSFKHPSGEELQHDFLWSATRRLPERGNIGIFNRSYYEEVLIVRVHPELLQGEGVPYKRHDQHKIWKLRYEAIRGLETHLHRNGTRIVKFFLHVSRAEQRKRLLARIDDPGKNWKFSPGDIEERKFWNPYMQAYEACLAATSTRRAPWYVVPADDKQNARLIVSKIVLDAIGRLDLSYPKADARRRKELAAARRQLAKNG